MTCIVGLVQGGKVYMGGDSAAVGGGDVQLTRLRKVFHKGPFLIGYTSSFRMGQLLQHCLEVPVQGEISDDAFMTQVFIEAVRKCLKDGGFMRVDSGQEQAGDFLVGYRGNLYTICGDLQVNTFFDDLTALGSGSSYAIGALAAASRMKPANRALKALEVASRFSTGVRSPFYVEEQSS